MISRSVAQSNNNNISSHETDDVPSEYFNPSDDADHIDNMNGSYQSLVSATRSSSDIRSPTSSKLGTRSSPPCRGFRPPAGILPPSTLYSVVIPASEMAAYEASNFKNVKGVYKNCRGIWAAQWTDERGQRHTKYFNPKYYTNESEARHEAFKFKVHIAREIELRGGVQKRRTPKISGLPGSLLKSNEAYMDMPYIRERQKPKTKMSKGRTGDSGYVGFDPNQWFRSSPTTSAADYLLLRQQYNETKRQKDFGLMVEPEEIDGTALLSNSTGSPLSAGSVGKSPPTTLMYNPQTFDSIFLPPSASQQYLPSTTTVNQLYRCLNGQSPTSDILNNSPTLPHGTSLCLCGCGELAIFPARYSSHHHMAVHPSEPVNNSTDGDVPPAENPSATASLFSTLRINRSSPESSGSNRKRKAEDESDSESNEDDKKKPRCNNENELEGSSPCMNPAYSTYPSNSEQQARDDSDSIAVLIDHMTRGNTEEDERLRDAALILLTSTGSSLIDDGNSREHLFGDHPSSIPDINHPDDSAHHET